MRPPDLGATRSVRSPLRCGPSAELAIAAEDDNRRATPALGGGASAAPRTDRESKPAASRTRRHLRSQTAAGGSTSLATVMRGVQLRATILVVTNCWPSSVSSSLRTRKSLSGDQRATPSGNVFVHQPKRKVCAPIAFGRAAITLAGYGAQCSPRRFQAWEALARLAYERARQTGPIHRQEHAHAHAAAVALETKAGGLRAR